jgi:hypothetical protein
MTTVAATTVARAVAVLRARLRAARNDEAGSASLTLPLGLTFIVIPVLILVLTLPTWLERTVDARDAAAQAARTLVTADTWTAGVTAAEQTVATETANDGLSRADLTASYTGTLTPGGSVTATVTVTIPAGAIPGIGAFGTEHYTASSTQLVDDYRSETG